jgi:ABC-2 type transport system permease protein
MRRRWKKYLSLCSSISPMRDIRTVAWKEWRELLRMSGTRRSAIARHIFSVAVISVLWPWQFGPRFLATNLAVTLAALTAAIYVAGAAPDTFAGERERHTLETLLASRLPDRAILLGKIIALLEYGCAAAVLMLIFGWVTVNVVHGEGQVLLYSRRALVSALLFAPVAAGLVAAIGIHVSLFAKTVKQAQQTFSTAALVVMFIPVIAISVLGEERVTTIIEALRRPNATALTFWVAFLMIGAQALLFGWALLRFKRGRLIL